MMTRPHPSLKTNVDGNPEPLVIGGMINGLGVVRSLAQEGLRTVIVDTKPNCASASRHARLLRVESLDGETLIDELLQLRKQLPNGGVLICTHDDQLRTVSRYRDRLTPHFAFLKLPSHERLVEIGLKDRFFQMAQEDGFPVPPTLLLRSHRDLVGLRDLRLPICLKPNIHTPAYNAAFKKAYRVQSHAEARDLCERILSVTGEVLAQEWIMGPNASIYFTLCYMGDPAPVAFTGRKGRSWPPQVGLTASCWAAPEVAEELEEMTIHFFHTIGITHGYASMEYKRDDRDGRFWMVEPTVGRVDGQVEISALCGVNLCYVAYCDCVGLPRPPLKLDPTHVWRDEFTDFISARKLGTICSYPSGHQIHNAYWRWDDIGPALRAAANLSKRGIGRLRRVATGQLF